MMQKMVANVSDKLAASFLEQQVFEPSISAAMERAERAMNEAMSENVSHKKDAAVNETAEPETPPVNAVADLVKQFEKLAEKALGFAEQALSNNVILVDALTSLNEAKAAAAQA